MTNTAEPQDPDIWHRVGITTDGVYQGLITGVSSFGLLVNAVDNAPRILNILPGEQGFSTFSDGDPVGGYDQIHRNLTGLYESYNDVAGVEVPQPVDLTDHALHMGGEVLGGLVVAGGTSMALQSSALTAGALQTSAGALTAAQESTALTTGLGASRSVLGAAWKVATLPYQAARMGFTAVAAGTTALGAGAALDIGLNDGRITTAAVREGSEFVVERASGIIMDNLGIDNLSETFNAYVPEGVRNAAGNAMEFLGENEQIAKWGSFAMIFLMGRSVLGSFTGNGFMASAATLAVSGVLAWGLSEMFKDKAVDIANARNEAERNPDIVSAEVQNTVVPSPPARGFAPA